MMNQVYVTIKDREGILRPLAYIETKERHLSTKNPKLDEGESFVEVEIKELNKHEEPQLK